MNYLYYLFKNCLEAPYTTYEDCADIAIIKSKTTLEIYFEASADNCDWKNNLDFPAVEKCHDGDCIYAHRGFVRVFKAVEEHIREKIMNKGIKNIIICGYSHGAALAVLCHEYVWQNRPDIQQNIIGFGFGCPRVMWGKMPEDIKKRWENFTVVRNLDDIITHLPPSALGYRHVGKMLEIGEQGKYSPFEAHKSENILTELKRSRL